LGDNSKNRLIAIFVIPILFVAGIMARGILCSSNVPNQEWQGILDNLCQTFTYFSDLIGQFTNRG